LNQARLLHLFLIFSVMNTTPMPTTAAIPIAISMVDKMLIQFSSGLVDQRVKIQPGGNLAQFLFGIWKKSRKM
jgi:hypothetical protein